MIRKFRRTAAGGTCTKTGLLSVPMPVLQATRLALPVFSGPAEFSVTASTA